MVRRKGAKLQDSLKFTRMALVIYRRKTEECCWNQTVFYTKLPGNCEVCQILIPILECVITPCFLP